MLTRWYLNRQLQELQAKPQPRFGIASVPALLAVAQLKQLIFTSTETFYTGGPQIKQFFAVEDQTKGTRESVLSRAGSLAAASGHPMLGVVSQYAQSENLPIREIEADAVGRCGVTGKLDRTWLVFGDQEAMEMEQIEIGVSAHTIAQQFEKAGEYVLYLAQRQPKRLLGIFACAFPLLPAASKIAEGLRGLGLELVLLSSARSVHLNAVNQELGLTQVMGDLKFSSKQEQIHQLVQAQPASGVVVLPGQSFQSPIKLVHSPVPTDDDLWFTDLAALGELITAAQNVANRTRRRFFWAKLKS